MKFVFVRPNQNIAAIRVYTRVPASLFFVPANALDSAAIGLSEPTPADILTMGYKPEVFSPIIKPVEIDMVDKLPAPERAPEHPLHDRSMHQDSSDLPVVHLLPPRVVKLIVASAVRAMKKPLGICLKKIAIFFTYLDFQVTYPTNLLIRGNHGV